MKFWFKIVFLGLCFFVFMVGYVVIVIRGGGFFFVLWKGIWIGEVVFMIDFYFFFLVFRGIVLYILDRVKDRF